MTETYDALVIGAGHNGLVCASYLGKAGKKVLVVEAANQVGGASVTREFADGFKVSPCAHILNMLNPTIATELNLQAHGLEYAATSLDTIALSQDGQHVTLGGDYISGDEISDKDVQAYSKFKGRMKAHTKTLAPLLMKRPPRLVNGDFADTVTLAKLGWDVRFGLGKDSMRDFLRVVGINIFDVLEEVFESNLIKGTIAFDAVLGTQMGPRSPNSVLSYLYRLIGELNGNSSGLALPKGGMGAVTAALARVAQANSTQIRTGAKVAKLVINDGRVAGAELEGGETVLASTVISNADPKTTLLKLAGAPNLEAYFAHRVNNIRMNGTAAKLHLALNGLPSFKGLGEAQMGQRLVIAPNMASVERAFDHSKYGEFSSEPAIEIVMPTVHDASLAPAGSHVMSAIVQYAPYKLKRGWENNKAKFLDVVLDTISVHAPDLRSRIEHVELLTPVDIEQEFGMTGGHWHHGELSIDQLLMMRPVYGAAQYKTPLDGLYLCSAGAHPGGGVMGAAGHNAAKAVIAESKAA